MGPLIALVALVGCTSRPPPYAAVTVDVGDRAGLSDLAWGPAGALFAVPERDPALVRIDPASGAVERLPLRGVPDGLDLEALAWDGAVWWFGTERNAARRADLVLRADPSTGVVRRASELDWVALFGVEPKANQGIEGLCALEGVLIALGEPVDERGGRFGLVARRGVTSGWTPYRVPLSSASGKLSAASCRVRGEVVEVTAIERHYEVSRLVRFDVPLAGEPGELAPAAVVVDLGAAWGGRTPNLEGLALRPGGAWIVADASGGGPTRLYDVPLGR